DFRPGSFGDWQDRLLRVALAIPRELVHRQEMDARRNATIAESPLIGVTVCTGEAGVDSNDVEVEGMGIARVARERLDTFERCNTFVVELELPPADGRVGVDLVELHECDRCEDVREVRLVR